MDPVIILLIIGSIFFLGLLSSILSDKMHIPNMLLLILVGIFLSNLPMVDGYANPFDNMVLISTIGTIALILIVFSYTSRFRVKDFDNLSMDAGLITVYSVVFSLLLLTFVAHFLLKLNIGLSLIFAASLLGTDPSSVAQFLPNIKNKSLKLLFVESIINSPITVLLPILFLDFVKNMPKAGELLVSFLTSFLSQIVTGIGAGFVIGLVFFKFMRKNYSTALSPIALITAAILSYGLAEVLDGNGIFAVTTLGLFYGSISLKNKFLLSQYSRELSEILEIFVFVMIGFLFRIQYLNLAFILKLIVIFAIYLFSRWLAVMLALRKSTYSKFEKRFITFLCPKGVVTVAIILMISLSNYLSPEIINLLIGFIFVSQLFSTIFAKVSIKKITDFSQVKPKNFSKNTQNIP